MARGPAGQKKGGAMMHRAIWIWAAVLILGQPGPALSQAPEQTIFGPKLYEHPTSDKSRTVDVVTVPAFIAGPFTLRIRNGEDRDGVHNASVSVNGVRSEERRVGKECRSRWSPDH